jgi:hypothetical protein
MGISPRAGTVENNEVQAARRQRGRGWYQLRWHVLFAGGGRTTSHRCRARCENTGKNEGGSERCVAASKKKLQRSAAREDFAQSSLLVGLVVGNIEREYSSMRITCASVPASLSYNLTSTSHPEVRRLRRRHLEFSSLKNGAGLLLNKKNSVVCSVSPSRG